MSSDLECSAPGPAMVKAVAEMIRNLEEIALDPSIIGKCPDLPGVVLDKVLAARLDRNGPEYAQVTRDYETLRADYLKALALHPVGRALAALAVGSAGVEMMERGRPPAIVAEVRSQLPGECAVDENRSIAIISSQKVSDLRKKPFPSITPQILLWSILHAVDWTNLRIHITSGTAYSSILKSTTRPLNRMPFTLCDPFSHSIRQLRRDFIAPKSFEASSLNSVHPHYLRSGKNGS